MSKHTNIGECPNCKDKLALAHPMLQDWFKKRKALTQELHISWSFRDRASQEAMFNEKPQATKLHFPNSAHNKTPALALDLFMLDADGQAQFPQLMYAKINELNEADNDPIIWGGTFKSIGDSDHFQVDLSKLPPTLEAA